MTFVRPRQGWAYVEGPVHCALYDTVGAQVLHLRGELSRLARACAKGRSVEEHLAGQEEAKAGALAEALLRLPGLEQSTRADPWERWSSASQTGPFRLRGAFLELTARCNLRCRHCYADATGVAGAADLDAGFWRRVLADVQALGGQGVVLTGGEPMLHAGFAGLLEDACARFGAERVGVLTNGTLVDEAAAALFARWRPSLSLSFYASEAATADAMTGVSGSFERTIAAFRRLQAAQAPFGVNVVLASGAGGELPGVRAFLEGLGIPRERIACNPVLPTGRGCALRSELELLRADFPHELVRPPQVAGERRLGCGTCWQGQLTVAGDGTVLLCNMLRDRSVGDLRAQSLAAVVASEKCQSEWSFGLDQVEPCRECELRFSCHDCRARAIVLGGGPAAKNPLCPYDPRTGESSEATHVSRRPAAGADARPRRRSGAALRRVGDELIASDAQGRNVLSLNPLAARILELCDGDRTAQDIAQRLFEEYDVELDRLRSDVDRTLGLLRAWELVEHG